ncbi:hypothetical protein FDP41_003078 [Naegleria fowleri]|uniref:Uncharacterized protein n=1 Tax=Naegleria fowleri TaxID=5763 RepID=A0A6A5BRJ4_NAEFO|nr:uncharacterized protein FDP41_003078 [Naegleria fowleri]KAF0977756.1 hypothetical protein FDP41_003078 [Naegleria fowleri]CAG4715452.1 unnamed protein product [Naegleria fowleri]
MMQPMQDDLKTQPSVPSTSTTTVGNVNATCTTELQTHHYQQDPAVIQPTQPTNQQQAMMMDNHSSQPYPQQQQQEAMMTMPSAPTYQPGMMMTMPSSTTNGAMMTTATPPSTTTMIDVPPHTQHLQNSPFMSQPCATTSGFHPQQQAKQGVMMNATTSPYLQQPQPPVSTNEVCFPSTNHPNAPDLSLNMQPQPFIKLPLPSRPTFPARYGYINNHPALNQQPQSLKNAPTQVPQQPTTTFQSDLKKKDDSYVLSLKRKNALLYILFGACGYGCGECCSAATLGGSTSGSGEGAIILLIFILLALVVLVFIYVFVVIVLLCLEKIRKFKFNDSKRTLEISIARRFIFPSYFRSTVIYSYDDIVNVVHVRKLFGDKIVLLTKDGLQHDLTRPSGLKVLDAVSGVNFMREFLALRGVHLQQQQ